MNANIITKLESLVLQGTICTKSSFIEMVEIGNLKDNGKTADLVIFMKGDRSYIYDVPADIIIAFVADGETSWGKAYSRYIKGHFKGERLE